MELTQELIEKGKQQLKEFAEKFNGWDVDKRDDLYKNYDEILGINVDDASKLIDVDYKDITLTMVNNEGDNKYWISDVSCLYIWNEDSNDRAIWYYKGLDFIK